MNRLERREFKSEIREIKRQNLETLSLFLKYCVENMASSISSIDRSMQVLEEVNQVISEEKNLLNFIKRNLKLIDSSELDKMLDMLDDLNEKTVMYYYELLDRCKSDSDIANKYQNLTTLTETDEYRKQVLSLALDIENVKEYLGIGKSAWEYINKRVISTEDEEFYGVNIKMNNDVVEDFKVFVPPIKNLETARINVHEFKHAYDVCKMLGIPFLESDYEGIAKKSEEEFEKVYINNKVKKYFC